jgi:predicted transcriptional regulator
VEELLMWCFALGKLDKPVLELLRKSPEPLSLAQIAQQLDKPEKTVFKTLRRLFEKDQIQTHGRQYAASE